MTTTALTPPECIVPDCFEPTHARSLCAAHYQRWRRDPTGEPPLPEIKAARHREWLIRRALTFGCLGEGQVWPFADEAEQRRAWEELGEEQTAEFRDDGRRGGHRPHAWWLFVAGRPEFLGRCPTERGGHGLAARVRWGHEAMVEKFTWMAKHGHLTAQEREWIAGRGREARERIKAGRERKAALGDGFGADREDVAIADAVEAAS
jgi:hypothetical protein